MYQRFDLDPDSPAELLAIIFSSKNGLKPSKIADKIQTMDAWVSCHVVLEFYDVSLLLFKRFKLCNVTLGAKSPRSDCGVGLASRRAATMALFVAVAVRRL